MKWLELELKFKPSFPNQFMRLGFPNSQTTKLVVLQSTPTDQIARNPRLRSNVRSSFVEAIAIHLRLPNETKEKRKSPRSVKRKPQIETKSKSDEQRERERERLTNAIEFSWKRNTFRATERMLRTKMTSPRWIYRQIEREKIVVLLFGNTTMQIVFNRPRVHVRIATCRVVIGWKGRRTSVLSTAEIWRVGMEKKASACF